MSSSEALIDLQSTAETVSVPTTTELPLRPKEDSKEVPSVAPKVEDETKSDSENEAEEENADMTNADVANAVVEVAKKKKKRKGKGGKAKVWSFSPLF